MLKIPGASTLVYIIQYWTADLLRKATGVISTLTASMLNILDMRLTCVVPVSYILYLFVRLEHSSEENEAKVCESLSGY